MQFVAIRVNKGAQNNLEAMKKQAIEAGYNFPYLYDENAEVGQGLRCDLHAARLRAGSRSQSGLHAAQLTTTTEHADEVKKQYLRDALEAIVAAKPRRRPSPRR